MWLTWIEEFTKPSRMILFLLISLAVYSWLFLQFPRVLVAQYQWQNSGPVELHHCDKYPSKGAKITVNNNSGTIANFHASPTFHLNKNLTCFDQDTNPKVFRRGRFWVFQNYIQAHQRFHCNETITYTTHADPTFFDNLQPLLERWRGPVSLSVYAPGTDFHKAVKAILYHRECSKANLVKNFVTFHMFFDDIFLTSIKEKIIQPQDIMNSVVQCDNFTANQILPVKEKLFKNIYKLKYPLNLARNLARESANSFFVFPCDIELYPSPGLIPNFLSMIRRNVSIFSRSARKVFPVSVFEIHSGQIMPKTKQELLKSHSKNKVQLFHSEICIACHKIPKWSHWMNDTKSVEFDIFTIGKRLGSLKSWEPFYIGTHSDPLYDERLYWEGRRDKMTQGFVLCLQDYEFHVLNNAFLVHKPGVKTMSMSHAQQNGTAIEEQNALILNKIVPELELIYGKRAGCSL